jgi:hypothetical protein
VRALSDYQLADWGKGTPLVHGIKRARNIATERIFRSLPARGYAAFMADLTARRPDVLAITIAYNTPWVIDLMTQVSPPNLNGTLVVCDNSRKSAARRAIARICKDRGVPYLALPFNLERHPCRSHGIVLNWAYHNIVAQVKPRVFGFLDHDLFAVEPLDLAAQVADQPVYGRIDQSVWGWNLWAGFCMFDRAAIAELRPDFNNDIPRRLDTGGRNFMQIYRHLDRDRIRRAGVRMQEFHLPGDPRGFFVQRIDNLLHVGGASFHDGDDDKTKLEEDFYRGVVRHVQCGGTLAELTMPPNERRVA